MPQTILNLYYICTRSQQMYIYNLIALSDNQIWVSVHNGCIVNNNCLKLYYSIWTHYVWTIIYMYIYRNTCTITTNHYILIQTWSSLRYVGRPPQNIFQGPSGTTVDTTPGICINCSIVWK